MLSSMLIMSLINHCVSQEVRVAVGPTGDIAQDSPPAHVHEPTLRVGDYRVSASMAKRSGFSHNVNPFSDMDRMEDKINDALKKKREMELAHQTAQAEDATGLIRRLQQGVQQQKEKQHLQAIEKHLDQHLTTAECKGVTTNKTCAFKNLYYLAGKEPMWLVVTLDKTSIPDTTGLTFASKYAGPMPIQVVEFKNKQQAVKAVALLQQHDPTQYKGLSLIFSAIWHQNIGHALWDGLYPAYTSLVQWGRQDESYRSVVDHDSQCYQSNTEDGRCMSEHVFKTFGKGDWVSLHTLSLLETKDKQMYHFHDVVVGSGNRGARALNADYSLPYGRELDAVRQFRDRMYISHGLKPPPSRTQSGQHRHGPRAMRGVVVHNPKYARPEKLLLESMATASGSIATSFTDQEGSIGAVNLQYVDFASLPDFKQHLDVIGHSDVHMSAVGTAGCLAPFLGDGSVHVNLGNNEWPGNQEVYLNGRPEPYSAGHGVSYMEEYWSEGVPYIRALYYNATTQHEGLKRRELQTLARKAYALIQSNFSIPVEEGENLSPVGKTFKEYCHSDKKACEYALNLMNGEMKFKDTKEANKKKDCQTYAWAEMAVFEVGAFGEDGHSGQHCDLHNIEKLREIREKHLGA